MGGHRVLVVGATGVFGERLATGLVAAGFQVLAVARGRDRLEKLRKRAGDAVQTLVCEREMLTAPRLLALRKTHPDLFAVADASGPFQACDLSLPEAAVGAGLHYVDLADARGFVAAVPSLDEAARAAGVAVLAGASSTPCLSHAVLDVLTAGTTAVHSVSVAISPGNKAPRGIGVVKAILSYAGRPVRVFEGGKWSESLAWGRPSRVGFQGLGPRWVSLCETPDLDLLARRYRPTSSATFMAGLELGLLQWGLYALGALVRKGIVRSLVPIAWALARIAGMLLPFGTDRGGMRVDAVVTGLDGNLTRRTWSLVADAGDGPYIPTLPAIAALRMLRDGKVGFRGAAPCVGLVPYDLIEAEWSRHCISTSTTTRPLKNLFATVLGTDWERLPTALQRAHEVNGSVLRLQGRAESEGRSSLLARIAAHAFGFPPAGKDMPVEVEMRAHEDGSETWTRRYPRVTMRSRLFLSKRPGRLLERFGPVTAEMAVYAEGQEIVLAVEKARFLGIVPVPRILAPKSQSREFVRDGKFHFDVPISVPAIGRLAHYRGSLTPES